MKTNSFFQVAHAICFDEADLSVRDAAFDRWFSGSQVVDKAGKPMKVYHGSQRADRIGTKIIPRRATSGPMPFFTDDPEVASNYSIGKADTSFEQPDDYAGWFVVKVHGRRNAIPIDMAWHYLDSTTKSKLLDRIYTVGYKDSDGESGPIVGNSKSIMPPEGIDYELRRSRGNVLRALVEIWLNSAAIFDREEMFMDVLKAAGMDMSTVTFVDPHMTASGVIPVYLAIRNPLHTSKIPDHVISTLEQTAKHKRRKKSTGSNSWDKNIISGKEWIDILHEDIKNGTTYAWTQIPDWVTQTLQSLGYDGIQDTGGKHEGPRHQVWIPFQADQVKSVFSKGFDPRKKTLID